MNKTRGLYIGSGLVVVGLIFQLFFRYDYIHLAGGNVMRVDRVTSASCYLPCRPTPVPIVTPTPTPQPTRTPIPLDVLDARIIDEKIRFEPTENFGGKSGSVYAWRIFAHYSRDGEEFDDNETVAAVEKRSHRKLEPADPIYFPIRLVCYCDSKFSGYYWEVTPYSPYSFETTSIKVTGNTVLEHKYHVGA